MTHRTHPHSYPTYGSDDNSFTCEFNHGGVINIDHEQFEYVGGRKDYFDYLDPDQMSLIELTTMVQQLGYSKKIKIWCKVSTERRINPKLLSSDHDLMVIIDEISKKNRVLQCFLHHDERDTELVEVNRTVDCVVEGDVEVDEENVGHTVVEVHEQDDASVGDSDFYDPQNDVEADDDDLIYEANVTQHIERDWILPPQNQPELLPEGESDYGPSDVLLSGGESDDDDVTSRRYPEFNPNVDMENPEFRIGMVFGSFKEFKAVVKEYAIKQRRNIRFQKNDTVRVKAVCKNGCPWNIWVSRMGTATYNVQVKTYNSNHTCANEHNIKFLTVDWLVKKYLDTFRSDPKWSLPGIIHRIRSDLHMEISTQKAWNVKSKALKILAGKEGSQYAKLQDYAAELKKSNVGSTIVYDLRLQVFQRAYVCLAACRDGFLAGCRRILSFDGCWLKGRYGGQLLSAIAIDANDCIFPVAYAIVESENSPSWRWFLQLLATDLGIANSHSWTFMSDRQKGLVPILNALFPRAEHRFCVRHMYQNYFNAGHKGKTLKDHLWMAAMTTHVADHEKWMLKLKKLSNDAYEWLNAKPAHEWSKSHFSTQSKCDMLLNNLCECFNKYILDARDKPIITMLEMIRTRLMRRFQVKRDTMMKYKGCICSKIQRKLDTRKNEAIKYTAIWNGGTQYQVTGPDGQFVVNIATHSC